MPHLCWVLYNKNSATIPRDNNIHKYLPMVQLVDESTSAPIIPLQLDQAPPTLTHELVAVAVCDIMRIGGPIALSRLFELLAFNFSTLASLKYGNTDLQAAASLNMSLILLSVPIGYLGQALTNQVPAKMREIAALERNDPGDVRILTLKQDIRDLHDQAQNLAFLLGIPTTLFLRYAARPLTLQLTGDDLLADTVADFFKLGCFYALLAPGARVFQMSWAGHGWPWRIVANQATSALLTFGTGAAIIAYSEEENLPHFLGGLQSLSALFSYLTYRIDQWLQTRAGRFQNHEEKNHATAFAHIVGWLNIKWQEMLDVWRLGSPLSLSILLDVLYVSLDFFWFVSRLGKNELKIMGLTYQAVVTFYVMMIGFLIAMIVNMNHSPDAYTKNLFGRVGLGMAVGFSSLVGVAEWFFAKPLLSFLARDPSIVPTALRFMPYQLIQQYPLALSVMANRNQLQAHRVVRGPTLLLVILLGISILTKLLFGNSLSNIYMINLVVSGFAAIANGALSRAVPNPTPPAQQGWFARLFTSPSQQHTITYSISNSNPDIPNISDTEPTESSDRLRV